MLSLVQDTIQVADSAVAVLGSALPTDTTVGVLFFALWQFLGPQLTSWLFSKWNILKGKLDGINNAFKVSAYIVLAWLVLFVPKLIGFVLDQDPNTWTPAVFFDFFTAAIFAIQTRIGIQQAKAKAVAPVTRASSTGF